MFKLNKIAAVTGALMALGYGNAAVAEPVWAVADAYLRVFDFTILTGDGAAGKSGIPLDLRDPTLNPTGTINVTSVVSTADTDATINGVGTDTTFQQAGIGVVVPLQQSTAGSGAANFVPYAFVAGEPTSTFAGGATQSSGVAIDPTNADDIPVHSQVSIASGGTIGSANANQTLSTRFTVIVPANTTYTFELNFLADGHLRAALGQNGILANTGINWSASVTSVLGDSIMEWSPNGTVNTNNLGGDCVGLGTCTEFLDGANLNRSFSALGEEDLQVDFLNGAFEVELTLGPGTYNFAIDHTTGVDASTPIPEPASLALIGAGLLGLGAANRRRKA